MRRLRIATNLVNGARLGSTTSRLSLTAFGQRPRLSTVARLVGGSVPCGAWRATTCLSRYFNTTVKRAPVMWVEIEPTPRPVAVNAVYFCAEKKAKEPELSEGSASRT